MTRRCRICSYLFMPKSGYSLYAHCDYGIKTGRPRPCPVNQCTVCRVKQITIPVVPAADIVQSKPKALPKRINKQYIYFQFNQAIAMGLYKKGASDKEIAAEMGLCRRTISRWRKYKGLLPNRT